MSAPKTPPPYPVTYYPVVTQELFRSNAERIKDKPYAKYFSGDMRLREEVLPYLKEALDPADTLSSGPEDLNTLLDPGYHRREMGFGLTESGHPYVAGLNRFPGCTAEMFTWWMWWHSVESERYSLWHPYCHVQAVPRNQDVLTQPGLTDFERIVGNTHDIVEYLGSQRMELVANFVDPAELGLDTSRFKEAGYHAYACAAIEGGVMIHLARDTDDGFEVRSRFIFDRGGPGIDADDEAGRAFGHGIAYELFVHLQSEFTHLSTFLADLYGEFGVRP
ncbi:DAPG hydrolase family protein [Streptomyces sp. YKOK-I1]